MASVRDRFWIWGVLYDHQLRLHVKRHLVLCGKLLGTCMWGCGAKQPMPLELMKQQFKTGLRLAMAPPVFRKRICT